jgi:hypothetical protein
MITQIKCRHAVRGLFAGQITMMLRQLGATPVATDFLVFYDVMSRRTAP